MFYPTPIIPAPAQHISSGVSIVTPAVSPNLNESLTEELKQEMRSGVSS